MATFLAVYRGDTVGSARLVAVSADPKLIADVSSRALEAPPEADEADPVAAAVQRGRHRALRIIKREVAGVD